MFEDLSIIFGWQTAVLCCAIYAIVFVTRKILEGIPALKLATNNYWRSVILPILPIIYGALIGLIPATSYLCPADLGATMVNRVIFGMVAGLFSGWVYAKILDVVKNVKLTKTDDTATIAPADVADISGK